MTDEQLKLAVAYLLIINIISVAVCFYDKHAAKSGRFRIPEKTLFLLCFAGGSVGMLASMKLIRHKTLHKRFMIGIPVIIIFQIILLLLYLTTHSNVI